MKGRAWRPLHKWPIAAVSSFAPFLSTAGAQGDDLAEAQRLHGQVLQYYATGRYQQAISAAERASCQPPRR